MESEQTEDDENNGKAETDNANSNSGSPETFQAFQHIRDFKQTKFSLKRGWKQKRGIYECQLRTKQFEMFQQQVYMGV